MSSSVRVILVVVALVVLVFMLIQVIPVQGRTNPRLRTQMQWNSAQTDSLVRGACYDCHSNETSWPWYSYIAPVSWMIAHDVQEGRGKLNFSEQPASQINPQRLIQAIQNGSMPPAYYRTTHPAARLTDEQKQQLIAGIQTNLAGQKGGQGQNGDNGAGSEAGSGVGG